MSNLAKTYARAVNSAANFIKTSFNIASGQWLLDMIANQEGSYEHYSKFYDKSDLLIYDLQSRFMSIFFSGFAGVFAGLAFAKTFTPGGILPSLSLWTAGMAASIFAGCNLHAGVASAIYGLRKLYNEGMDLIEEDDRAIIEEMDEAFVVEDASQNPHKAENDNDEKIASDYNGPDQKPKMQP